MVRLTRYKASTQNSNWGTERQQQNLWLCKIDFTLWRFYCKLKKGGETGISAFETMKNFPHELNCSFFYCEPRDYICRITPAFKLLLKFTFVLRKFSIVKKFNGMKLRINLCRQRHFSFQRNWFHFPSHFELRGTLKINNRHSVN